MTQEANNLHYMNFQLSIRLQLKNLAMKGVSTSTLWAGPKINKKNISFFILHLIKAYKHLILFIDIIILSFMITLLWTLNRHFYLFLYRTGTQLVLT